MKRSEGRHGEGGKHGGGHPRRRPEEEYPVADEGRSAAEGEGPVEELSALEEKAAKADEYYDRLLRLKAEFENFKKRTRREKAELISQANHELILELLPAIDSFELGLESAEKTGDIDTLVKGLKLALGELLQVLGKFGLGGVEAEGRKFDPRFHEAVTVVESAGHGDETVVDEIRKGYLLHDKLLRPAMVTVARSGTKPPSGGGEESGPDGAGKDTGRRG